MVHSMYQKNYTFVIRQPFISTVQDLFNFSAEGQGYSKRQDFSPFPLLETCSFFLIWYFMIKKAMLVVGLIKKDSNIILICPKPNYHFFWLCNTKLEKKNVFLTVERGKNLAVWNKPAPDFTSKNKLLLVKFLTVIIFIISWLSHFFMAPLTNWMTD